MKIKTNQITAIILAGGKSSRLKKNKAFLPINGKTLIETVIGNLTPYFDEIIISASSKRKLCGLPCQTVLDEQPGFGPLMGILSGLRASKNQNNFIIACDIPEFNHPFFTKMLPYINHHEIVVPVNGHNLFEPLFAFYRKNLIPLLEKHMQQDKRKVNQLLANCHTKYVGMEDNDKQPSLKTGGARMRSYSCLP